MHFEQFNILLALAGALILLLGLFSAPIKRFVSPPLIALTSGTLAGPAVAGVLFFAQNVNHDLVIEQVARIAVAFSVMGIALRLSPELLRSLWKPVTILLALGMIMMWAAGTALTYFVLGIPILAAALVGAIITPTDPVVASSIVIRRFAQRHLPERIRLLVSFEAGANDGLAYLFVFLPILFMQKPAWDALSHWGLMTLLWEVVGASLIGLAIGVIAGKLLEQARATKEIDSKVFFIAYGLALSVFTLAVAKLANTDGILAVFLAGVGFTVSVEQETRSQEEELQESGSNLLTLPTFILLGIVAPWHRWIELGWVALLFVALILLLRRLPALMLLYAVLSPLRSKLDMLFVGWFGPIGASALFYSMLALRHTHNERVWEISSLVIVGSVVGHGLTAGPFTRLYSTLQNRDTQRSSAPASGR